MGKIEDEILKLLHHNLILQQRVLTNAWLKEQYKEGDKVADNWDPYFIDLQPTNEPGARARQILNHNPSRQGCTIANNGSTTAILGSFDFDVVTAQNFLNGGSAGIFRCYPLIAQASISLPSKGAVYAACLTTSTVLYVIETTYAEKLPPAVQQHNEAGVFKDGVLR